MRTSQRSIHMASFVWFYIFATAVALVFAGVWFMSPLGFGFAPWPADAGLRAFAQGLYQVSYFGGIPALLLGQVVSLALALALTRRSRLAYYVPLTTIGVFGVSVAIVMSLMMR